MSDETIFDDLRPNEATAKASPCGCKEGAAAHADIFAETTSHSIERLGADLDAALAAFAGSEENLSLAQDLSAEEELDFADLETQSGVTLQDILALVERNPGLKITFSF